jgi:hypothetical protein
MDEERQPISFLSYLQAENIKLRQAIVDLSLDTMALRKALAKRVSAPGANVRTPDRRRSSAAESAVRTERSPHR